MLMLLTCEGPHAADLGYLLHKHPDKLYERPFAHGTVSVFYPESGPERATAALVVAVDAIDLARGGKVSGLDHYVNDRPYVASSFTSVGLREAFGSALAGKSKDRPEVATKALPLRVELPAVHVDTRGLVERLFAPLGYEVSVTPHPLDPHFPAWGESKVVSVRLAAEKTVREVLAHLYVLLPVLDGDKHYFVGDAEVEKLVAHGEGWLAAHPERELIARRGLAHQRTLVRDALSQLEVGRDASEQEESLEAAVPVPPRAPSLAEQRVEAVVEALKAPFAEGGVRRVIDMGCGEGRLLLRLVEERAFEAIAGVDVSPRALERAEKRLGLDRRADRRERVQLLQGSLVYDDARLHGWDALALVEVIEHVDESRLDVVAKVLFERLRPRRIVLTTPNREYNARFESLEAGSFRHEDHRFEWTRAELRAWCARAPGYTARYSDVGPADPEVGAPTQLVVLERESAS